MRVCLLWTCCGCRRVVCGGSGSDAGGCVYVVLILGDAAFLCDVPA